MSTDPLQVLKVHFAEYASSNMSQSDWEMVNREFGIHDSASNIHRFYQSYHWSDPDMKKTTLRFLDKIQDNEGEEFMLKVMRRSYDKKGGASDDLLEENPALTALEGKDADISANIPAIPLHSKEFISLDNIPGTFYPKLIGDINTTYRIGIYDSTLVLSRKLIENLIIELLRKKYDTDRLELYYDTDIKQFQNLNTLKENFEENLGDFEHYSDSMDSDFISLIDEFRHTANRGAHSIEVSLTQDEMDEYSDNLKKIVPVLFRVSSQL